MDGRFAEEGHKRQQENQQLKAEIRSEMEAGWKKVENAGHLIQNDLAVAVVAVAVPFAVMPAPQWEEKQAELLRDHHGALISVYTTSCRERKNLRDWSPRTDGHRDCGFITDLQQMVPDKYQKEC